MRRRLACDPSTTNNEIKIVIRSLLAACAVSLTLATGMACGQTSVVSIADATISEGALVNQTTVSMTNPAGRFCQVAVTTSNGTAVAPDDYGAISGSLFNMIGVASDVLGLTIVDDGDIEPNETFTIAIALTAGSDPQCVLGKSTATITIVSDDVASVVSIADATVPEGVVGPQTTISMTNPSGRFCQVAVTTSNGTAVTPDDYNAISGSLFNMSGVASDVLGLTIVDDGDSEGTQYFAISIALTASSDAQCRLGKSTAMILIVDNDAPADATPPGVTVNQSPGQADPTASSPVLFTVVFDEPVIGFTAADIDLSSSTIAATLTPTVTGGPATYTVSVAVSGASAGGTIVATVPANAATDGVNNSLASTSTDNTVGYVVPVSGPGSSVPVPVDDHAALLLVVIAVALAARRRLRPR